MVQQETVIIFTVTGMQYHTR